MSHVADAGFYQKVSQTFPTNSIILMEGVKDDENLLTNKISYKRMAKSLGLAEQHEKFVPTRGEMVMADVDVDQFSPDTIDCLNLVMLVHSRGLNPGIVLKLMQYSPSPHIEDELINDLLRKRNQHLAEEIQSHLSESDNIMVPWGVAHMPGIGLLEKIWPACVKYAQKYGKQWVVGFGQLDSGREQLLIDLCTQAGQPERGKELLAMLTPNQPAATAQPVSDHPSAPNPFQASSQMVPTPPWARDMQMFYSMFRLFPPNALPLEVQPTMQEFRFPNQFEVQTVDQMDFLQDKLLILAMDERSAQSSDANPDVSAETLAKRGRLWILETGATSPVLFEPQLFPETVHSFLLRDDRLWVAGNATGYLDLKTQNFRKFDLANGFALQQANSVGFAGDDIFVAGDFIKVCRFHSATDRWTELPNPTDSYGSDPPGLLVGNNQWLNFAAEGDFVYDTTLGAWTNPLVNASVQCAVSDDSGFWLGSRDGLHFYDPADKSSKHWTTPGTINCLFISMMGHSFTGNNEMPAGNLEKMDEQIQGLMKKLQEDRTRNHAAKHASNAVANPMHLDWRVPGEVTALANDGDFLWVGIGNFFGNYLLLLNKPSESLVAYCPMQARDKISSLAVSKTTVWIGTAYGDHKLLQLPKSSFQSIPQSSWVSVAISPNEREQLIRGMSIRDQAMYAFYAGDDARVATLLGDIDPDKARLEQMFLLAFSYDALGLDKPDLARTWFENIISRYPDSAWAKTAQTALSENEHNHKAKEHQEALSSAPRKARSKT